MVWGWGRLSFLEQLRQTPENCRSSNWELALTVVSARREQTEAAYESIVTGPRVSQGVADLLLAEGRYMQNGLGLVCVRFVIEAGVVLSATEETVHRFQV